MEAIWLRRKAGAEAVIVFFAGWGAEPADVAHLGGDADVLLVRDYRDLDADLPDLSAYRRKLLVAWSFGVAAYGHWQMGRIGVFDRRIAVNGTLAAVDRDRGIAPKVLQMTIDGLSEDGFHAFRTRSHGAEQPRRAVDLAARKAELEAVRDRGPSPDCDWDRIWIGTGDRVFPVQAQRRAWAGQADRIQEIDAPHAPFAGWSRWEDLL